MRAVLKAHQGGHDAREVYACVSLHSMMVRADCLLFRFVLYKCQEHPCSGVAVAFRDAKYRDFVRNKQNVEDLRATLEMCMGFPSSSKIPPLADRLSVEELKTALQMCIGYPLSSKLLLFADRLNVEKLKTAFGTGTASPLSRNLDRHGIPLVKKVRARDLPCQESFCSVLARCEMQGSV